MTNVSSLVPNNSQGGQPQNFPKREIRGRFGPKEEAFEEAFSLKRKLFSAERGSFFPKEEAFSPRRGRFGTKEEDFCLNSRAIVLC